MKTLVLSRKQVETLASVEAAVAAVEQAFSAFGRGEGSMPPKVYLRIDDHGGDFRAMPARLGTAAGVKWVNVHRKNRDRGDLPTVMAVYILSDPQNGFPLAIMDGTLLTALRTGAAAAVASKYLATHPPATIGLIGCGAQAHTLLAAHRVVFNDFEVLAADRDMAAATQFAAAVDGNAVSVEEAAGADIVCTATPSRTPFVKLEWLNRGAHINAMGADAEGKQELETSVLRNASVYVDDAAQATHSGEINVPFSRGQFRMEDIAGTLGEVVAGVLARPEASTTTVFDSTGLAIQDVALAQAIYRSAKDQNVGREIDLLDMD